VLGRLRHRVVLRDRLKPYPINPARHQSRLRA
jgi:hypothetical protein